jgi:hypothetical protein
MKNRILKKICTGLLLLATAPIQLYAQNCGSDVTIVAYTQIISSGPGMSCNYNVAYSITAWQSNWKSYQVSVSCDNGPFQLVKHCDFLPANPPENNETATFGGVIGSTVIARFEFGTSNANCLGGTTCSVELPLSALPVKLGAFNILEENNRPLLNWQAEFEEDVKHYVVERSADGRHFTPIDTVLPQPGSVLHDYRYADIQFTGSGAYYRIKTIEKDGEIFFTETKVYKAIRQAQMNAWPVPANSHLYFSMKNHAGYRYQVFTPAGRLVQQGEAVGVGKIYTTQMPAGVYVLVLKAGPTAYQRLFTVEK